MGADYNQSLKAFKEAADYEGPSLILALSTCIDWGIDMKRAMSTMGDAVQSGNWPLYRYDPRKETPMQMDYKKLRITHGDYMDTQNRFTKLKRENAEKAKQF